VDDRIGTLEVGKQADVLTLRTDLPNLAPMTNCVGAVVRAAGTHNVDRVYVAGRLVKREGQLVGIDLTSVIPRAQSRDYLMATAGAASMDW
jgi:5-methylthioadenosine/S-adenosylhomocysteine deaminase